MRLFIINKSWQLSATGSSGIPYNNVQDSPTLCETTQIKATEQYLHAEKKFGIRFQFLDYSPLREKVVYISSRLLTNCSVSSLSFIDQLL